MRILFVMALVYLSVVCGELFDGNSTAVNDQCPNVKQPLSLIRKRRYLVFGEGSNAVITIQLVKAWVFKVPSGWNLALEIDVQYPLPDAKFSKSQRKLKHHHQKRELWERIENALDMHNLNGRSCILRGICEAREHLAPRGRSLVHDVLRAIFTAPLHEEDFTNEIQHSYREMLDPEFCTKPKDCPVSILNYLLSLNKQKVFLFWFNLHILG